jgi:hypothetical protein
MRPSPRFLTSVPPDAAIALRRTEKCARRSSSAASGERAEASSVEPTRSVKRIVTCSLRDIGPAPPATAGYHTRYVTALRRTPCQPGDASPRSGEQDPDDGATGVAPSAHSPICQLIANARRSLGQISGRRRTPLTLDTATRGQRGATVTAIRVRSKTNLALRAGRCFGVLGVPALRVVATGARTVLFLKSPTPQATVT